MEIGQQLKSLLQLQLATDTSAVINLAHSLQILDKSCFSPNPHLAKWTARIGSLLHSKDAGGRWAGLCLAHKSSLLSRDFMVDSASSWLPVALPMLSRNESAPTTKAAIRLFVTIFTTALDMPEFHRQISTPNITKFTQFLSSIATSSTTDSELKVLCLEALSHIVPAYPNAHRQSFSQLSSLCLGFLNGNHPCPTDSRILNSAAKLYAILHLTGGKVGAAAIWRKSLDDTLAFGWNAYFALRTTFPSNGSGTLVPPQGDPSTATALNIDRLKCCSVIVVALLQTLTTRPVQISCGNLVKFGLALISSTLDEKIEGFTDPLIRAFEVAAVPEIWKAGCSILSSLAEAIPQHLNPYVSRVFTVILYHLEQPCTINSQRAYFLDTIQTVLNNCQPVDAPILPNRMVKAVLPFLIIILDTKKTETPPTEATGTKNSRKRARNYEGDEVFKVTRDVICPTAIDGKVFIHTLEVLRHCLKNPNLAVPQLSLASRVLLSIQLALAQMDPSTFSNDLTLFDQVSRKAQSMCAELAFSSTVSLHKATPLIIASLLEAGASETWATIDLLLHPRLPPLVRPIPATHSISLFKVEESQEEIEARQQLRIDFDSEEPTRPGMDREDVVMADSSQTTSTAPVPAPQFTTRLTPGQSTLSTQNSTAKTPVASVPPTATTDSIQSLQVEAPKEVQYLTPSNWSAQKPKEAPQPTMFPITPAEDEDEEMPTIDMASDSEDEE